MSTSAERTLENAVIAAVEALTYISANSIPVRNWDDNDENRALPCITVRVSPRERVAPNYPMYKYVVDVVAFAHRGEDPTQAVLDQVYNDVVTWVGGIDAVADFSADGVMQGIGSEEVDGSIHSRSASFDIFKQ